MPAALSDLRVLDLSRVLAGPWAGQLLADFGAEVIKVEKPGAGDDTRHWGPPFIAPGADGRRDAAYYLAANRGKHSVAIDMSTPDGQALVRRLAERSDVVIENYRRGTLARWGLDYASLQAVNPGVIYCSITGFGQTGPYADRPGYDFLVQGMGGLMSVTGPADGEPQKVGVAITDIFTGMYATVAILAALAWRRASGEGQHIDLALLDVQVATLANQALNFLVGGTDPVRLGNAHPNVVPYQVFAAADGHLIVATGNDGQYRSLVTALGLLHLAEDPRFLTNAGRVEHRDALAPLLAARLASRSMDEWLTVLEAAGVPCGPINTLSRVFSDPQVTARQMRLDLVRPDGTATPGVANPIKASRTPPQTTRAAPALGADTDAVLARVLGISAGELAGFRGAGIIG